MAVNFRSRRTAEPVVFDKYEDPLLRALRPPQDESAEDRVLRLQKQQEAQRISREIDESILASKHAFEKRKKAVKILLLGQAESGKSTTLKNFQLTFAPNHFRSERAAWKTVIQLNLIGSVKKLLELLSSELESDGSRSPQQSSSRSPTRTSSQSLLTDNHRRIRMRLSPLLSVETNLTRKILPENIDPSRMQELCVRAGSGWKAILERATSPPIKRLSSRGRGNRPSTAEGRSDDPTTVLANCKDDIIAIWNDPVVRLLLHQRGVRLDHSPGFFLDDTARIADMKYEPTDSDIVRARLRTCGVEEHRLVLENGAHPGSEWYIYDVGGSRGMRPHWVPYFDDIQAIIFLAPLAFNQMLEEDSKVNRLQDSIHLWQEICANPLLTHATLILFLNKMDILEENLKAGVLVQKFVPSYGNAPNDPPHVTKYFREKFHAYQKRLSPKPRPFFCHETSAIDTQATRAILVGVQEGILRAHLQKINVI